MHCVNFFLVAVKKCVTVAVSSRSSTESRDVSWGKAKPYYVGGFLFKSSTIYNNHVSWNVMEFESCLECHGIL